MNKIQPYVEIAFLSIWYGVYLIIMAHVSQMSLQVELNILFIFILLVNSFLLMLSISSEE